MTVEAVAAFATVSPAEDTLTVLLLVVLIVGAVVVLTAVVFGTTVLAVFETDWVSAVLLIVEILTITIPTHTGY